MIWEPYALAVVLGLLVSAGLYFVIAWPQVEPPDDEDEEAPALAADPTPTTEPPAAETALAEPPLAEGRAPEPSSPQG